MKRLTIAAIHTVDVEDFEGEDEALEVIEAGQSQFMHVIDCTESDPPKLDGYPKAWRKHLAACHHFTEDGIDRLDKRRTQNIDGSVWVTNQHLALRTPRKARSRKPGLLSLPKKTGSIRRPVYVSRYRYDYGVDGNQLDARYLGLVTSIFGKVIWRSAGLDQPVTAWLDGKIVAILMPTRSN